MHRRVKGDKCVQKHVNMSVVTPIVQGYGMLLTLFLVQHHRPEERGVLPRAIRGPRLQEAAPFALLNVRCSWKRL